MKNPPRGQPASSGMTMRNTATLQAAAMWSRVETTDIFLVISLLIEEAHFILKSTNYCKMIIVQMTKSV